jgi:hypothetical protein
MKGSFENIHTNEKLMIEGSGRQSSFSTETNVVKFSSAIQPKQIPSVNCLQNLTLSPFGGHLAKD